MLSKDGASLLQRMRLDKLELRQFHLIPRALNHLPGSSPLDGYDRLIYLLI